MITVDAHQHFWELGRFAYEWLQEPSLQPIRRNFLPDDLQPLLQERGIEKTIFVQTQHDLAENRWVLNLAQHSILSPASWAGSIWPARSASSSCSSCGNTPSSSAFVT